MSYLTSDVTIGEGAEYPTLPGEGPPVLFRHLDDRNREDGPVRRVDEIGHRTKAY